MIVCHCHYVSSAVVETAIVATGATTVSEVTEHTDAGGGCGSCWPTIQALLAKAPDRQMAEAAA
jgi:NAD(P)H-nitrite reductase large subunit